MRILLKCPTRSRREQFLHNLSRWVELADKPELLGIAVTCDLDDDSMRDVTEADLPATVAWRQIFRGTNRTKIEACNANMHEIPWTWDIVILVSDDMVPQVQGYDTRIREAMKTTDHVVWINDGIQGRALNTLNIFGRRRFETWGYLYHPSYKSFYCDNEVTDWCNSNPEKCTYIPEVLIRHIHFITGAVPMDSLYQRNQSYLDEDRRNYEFRRIRQRFSFVNLLSRR